MTRNENQETIRGVIVNQSSPQSNNFESANDCDPCHDTPEEDNDSNYEELLESDVSSDLGPDHPDYAFIKAAKLRAQKSEQ
jgi:hypothetical protein